MSEPNVSSRPLNPTTPRAPAPSRIVLPESELDDVNLEAALADSDDMYRPAAVRPRSILTDTDSVGPYIPPASHGQSGQGEIAVHRPSTGRDSFGNMDSSGGLFASHSVDLDTIVTRTDFVDPATGGTDPAADGPSLEIIERDFGEELEPLVAADAPAPAAPSRSKQDKQFERVRKAQEAQARREHEEQLRRIEAEDKQRREIEEAEERAERERRRVLDLNAHENAKRLQREAEDAQKARERAEAEEAKRLAKEQRRATRKKTQEAAAEASAPIQSEKARVRAEREAAKTQAKADKIAKKAAEREAKREAAEAAQLAKVQAREAKKAARASSPAPVEPVAPPVVVPEEPKGPSRRSMRAQAKADAEEAKRVAAAEAAAKKEAAEVAARERSEAERLASEHARANRKDDARRARADHARVKAQLKANREREMAHDLLDKAARRTLRQRESDAARRPSPHHAGV